MIVLKVFLAGLRGAPDSVSPTVSGANCLEASVLDTIARATGARSSTRFNSRATSEMNGTSTGSPKAPMAAAVAERKPTIPIEAMV